MASYVTISSEKDKTTALLLCIFGGFFGLHYFYVGRYGRGFLFLITLGFFGLGWIVDIISIASGSFRDNAGAPLRTAHGKEQRAAPTVPAPAYVPPTQPKVSVKSIGKCEVVGESFYKSEIKSICEIDPDYYWPQELLYQKYVEGDIIYKYRIKDARAKLIPEPDNTHDKNAIRVEIAGKEVGHIPKEQTASVRQLMQTEGFYAEARVGGGPLKEVIENADATLSAIQKDLDFSVVLAFYAKEKIAPPRDEPPIDSESKHSILLTVLFWAVFSVAALGALALVSALVLPAASEILQPYAFPITAMCFFLGVSAYGLAGKVFD